MGRKAVSVSADKYKTVFCFEFGGYLVSNLNRIPRKAFNRINTNRFQQVSIRFEIVCRDQKAIKSHTHSSVSFLTSQRVNFNDKFLKVVGFYLGAVY